MIDDFQTYFNILNVTISLLVFSVLSIFGLILILVTALRDLTYRIRKLEETKSPIQTEEFQS